MWRRCALRRGWHYVHPLSGRPIKQIREYRDPRYINNEVALIRGQWGLITADFGVITQSQMENARIAVLRRIDRSNFTLVMHTDFEEIPITRRPKESRMGGGRGPIHLFAFKFTTGIPLFEITPHEDRVLTHVEAETIFYRAREQLPLATVVVPQGRVDEHTYLK